MVSKTSLADHHRHDSWADLRHCRRAIPMDRVRNELDCPVWRHLHEPAQAHCRAAGAHLPRRRRSVAVRFQKTVPDGGQNHRPLHCHHRCCCNHRPAGCQQHPTGSQASSRHQGQTRSTIPSQCRRQGQGRNRRDRPSTRPAAAVGGHGARQLFRLGIEQPQHASTRLRFVTDRHRAGAGEQRASAAGSVDLRGLPGGGHQAGEYDHAHGTHWCLCAHHKNHHQLGYRRRRPSQLRPNRGDTRRAGLLLYRCGDRPAASHHHCLPWFVEGFYTVENLAILQGHWPSTTARFLHQFQRGHAAGHHAPVQRETGCLKGNDLVRSPSWRNHQHGRHRPLSGRRGGIHSPSVRYVSRYGGAIDHRHHRRAGLHRHRRCTRGRDHHAGHHP